MTTMLWDVDTQHDFCDAEGALSVTGAADPDVRGRMRALVAAVRQHGWHHVASADSHVHAHPEIALAAADWVETFPPHCMRGTHGSLKIPETLQRDPLVLGPEDGALADSDIAARLADPAEVLLLKHELSVFSNPNADRILRLLAPDRIVVFGVATDICVDATLAGLIERRRSGAHHAQLVFVEGASAGLDPTKEAEILERHEAAGLERVDDVDQLER